MSEVEIGRPEGRTSYSDYAERYYAQAGAGRNSLSASEYVASSRAFGVKSFAWGSATCTSPRRKTRKSRKRSRPTLRMYATPTSMR